jgi:hypothetical protein
MSEDITSLTFQKQEVYGLCGLYAIYNSLVNICKLTNDIFLFEKLKSLHEPADLNVFIENPEQLSLEPLIEENLEEYKKRMHKGYYPSILNTIVNKFTEDKYELIFYPHATGLNLLSTNIIKEEEAFIALFDTSKLGWIIPLFHYAFIKSIDENKIEFDNTSICPIWKIQEFENLLKNTTTVTRRIKLPIKFRKDHGTFITLEVPCWKQGILHLRRKN